jgi:hypothetical protein
LFDSGPVAGPFFLERNDNKKVHELVAWLGKPEFDNKQRKAERRKQSYTHVMAAVKDPQYYKSCQVEYS